MGPEEIQEEDAQIQTPPGTNNTDNTEEEHKAKSVIKALGLHLKLSMADVIMTFASMFLCNFYGTLFFYIYQIICFFWLPFLVIRASFKELVSVPVPVIDCLT